jgi:hypothetical protein
MSELKPISVGNSYQNGMNPSSFTFENFIQNTFYLGDKFLTIDFLYLDWFWMIPHSASGPQNISSTSTIYMYAIPTISVMEQDKIIGYNLVDSNGNLVQLNYSCIIDPSNGPTDTSKRGPIRLNLKGQRVQNQNTGEIISDASQLFFKPVVFTLILIYDVSNPGNSLGSGVTNTNIFGLKTVNYVNLTGFGLFAS